MQAENLQIANGRGWPRMAADEDGHRINRLSHVIIGAGQKVSQALGAGFLERVYENALALELRKSGVQVEQQCGIRVFYGDEVVGVYSADLLVERRFWSSLRRSGRWRTLIANSVSTIFELQACGFAF